MPTNGSNKLPTIHHVSTPVVNNWVWTKFKDGTQEVLVMTIYNYRQIRDHLMWGVDDNIVAMGVIKPKNESEYLRINKMDTRTLVSFNEYLLSKRNEINNKKTN